MFPWYETRCEKHSACLNRELPLLPGDGGVLQESESLQGPVASTGCGPLTFLCHRPRARIPRVRPIGPIERVMFPRRPRQQFPDVRQLSVERWPFDNTVSFFFFSPPKPPAKGRTCRPLRSHYQWNPCLDKWRETNVLLWRKVLSQRVRVAAKSPKWRDKIIW